MSGALRKNAFLLILIALLWLIIPALLYADELPYVEGEVLIRFKRQMEQDAGRHSRVLSEMRMEVLRHFPLNDVYLVRTKADDSVEGAVKRLNGYPGIEYAEPNYRRYITSAVPNDPLFSSQWAHQKIQSTDAWGIETGKESIVIAVSDTGIDYNHEDLKGNLWRNSGEDWIVSSPGNNGVDDDGDGYIDNYYGINTITGSGDPMDDESHGTHVAGIAGAVGNNSKGITGVNWNVSIMALKFIGADGTGSVADEIETIEFARLKGVRVVNMSFGGSYYSTFERDAIANASDILFVTSAGNDSLNNDVYPTYPGSYNLPNIISVAATDQSDKIAYFSNYGRNTVSVSAPGLSILSTVLGDSYTAYSGTSMSTPFVSGLAALLFAKNPLFSVSQVKDRILRSVDKTSELEDKTLSGGRINAYRALTEHVTGPYIYSLSPVKGPVGSQVTIRGSNFKDVEGTVTFGGLQAQVLSWTNEKIICSVPEGASSGLVYVTTTDGTSNGVNFSVTVFPTMTRLSFPYASTEAGQRSYIVLSNFLDYPVTIYAKAVGESGDSTLKVLTLSAYEKVIWDLNKFGILNETLFITTESEEFFAATVLSLRDDLSKLIAIPHIMGGLPASYEEPVPGR